ncbi:histidine kinase dimerization/phospho-acceptor domain-containing protein [Cereibacter changlensis]|uniref:histidine kinase dimerization/phospho-acceptor domain-containing protein n=1 Tax=Cereibacter changlensis TaxID=402884 RepID=UPI004034C2F0
MILPLLAAAIWISLGRGLSPLRRIAEQLTRRGADDLAALEAETPREVAPMVAALNGLFGRVQAARRREQDFTAYAAHELKTPLAGLKMQAEVARLAPRRGNPRPCLGADPPRGGPLRPAGAPVARHGGGGSGGPRTAARAAWPRSAPRWSISPPRQPAPAA